VKKGKKGRKKESKQESETMRFKADIQNAGVFSRMFWSLIFLFLSSFSFPFLFIFFLL